MRYINLEQGTQDWLDWRTCGIGGSDAPVVMGVSPYDSPLGLWQLKRGSRPPQPDNPAMRRGRLMEEPARLAYEQHTGQLVVPRCAEHEQHPFIRASFDGLSMLDPLGVEIKCPGRVSHEMALQGLVPPWYWPQVQHLMLVSGYDHWHYWSYDGKHGVLIEVARDPDYIGKLLDAEIKFWNHVLNNVMPIEKASLVAANAWRVAKQQLSQAEVNLEWAKERLVKEVPLDAPGSIDVGLATIICADSAGPVDWKKLAEDHGIDDAVIEKYRKDGSRRVSVREATARKTQQVMEEMERMSIPTQPVAVNQTSDEDEFSVVW